MRLRIWISAVLVGVILVVLSVPLQAHHSIPAFYDAEKTVSVTGVVKQVRIQNPHSTIFLEGAELNGLKATWVAILASGSALAKEGWTNDTLKVGSTITITGNPARAKDAKGMVVKFVTMSDGKTLTPGKID